MMIVPIKFEYDVDKVREALVYLASRSAGLDKYKACKLLFLADKYHLVRYGRTITGDTYYAMPHGPAPTTILNLLTLIIDNSASIPEFADVLTVNRSFRYPRLEADALPQWDNLSKSDREALDETLRHFDKVSPWTLKLLTHDMAAYKNAWDKRKNKKSVPMAFEDFFEDDPDALAGVLEEAVEDSEIRSAFSGH